MESVSYFGGRLHMRSAHVTFMEQTISFPKYSEFVNFVKNDYKTEGIITKQFLKCYKFSKRTAVLIVIFVVEDFHHNQWKCSKEEG